MIIAVRNMRLRTVIGVYDWERESPREVVVNLEMELDGDRAAQTDRLEDTIDYATLSERIIEEVERSRFFLIERLADFILQIVMEDERIHRAQVEVSKPGALPFAESVSVICSAKR